MNNAVVPTQLPLWPEPQRGIPNSILRSALFGIVRRGRRSQVRNERIACWPGISIVYTGFRLDQSDLDVWLLAVHLARHHSLGSRIHFSAYGFLQGIGRSQGKQNREWLKSAFIRLMACAVEINIGDITYAGTLVQDFFLDRASGKYVLTVNPRLAKLFEEGYTLLDWQMRTVLRSDLAKWVHCFIRSHEPGIMHKISIAEMLELCGSESKRISEFRYRLKEAMSELEAVGEVRDWCLTQNGILEFARAGGA